MAWDLLDRTATLRIEVDGVKLELKPLAWGERASFAQRLARSSDSMKDIEGGTDVDKAVSKMCSALASVVISIDGKSKSPEQVEELFQSLNNMEQFLKIQGAIFGAYKFGETTEKN